MTGPPGRPDPLDGVKGTLELMLADYRAQVEREFADGLCGLIDRLVEAREAAAASAGTMEDSLDAAAEARALADFRGTIRVMASLDPGE